MVAQKIKFEYKQIIVVRQDLRLSRGKLAVQVAHAAILASEKARKYNPVWWSSWIHEGQKKAVVKVSTVTELVRLKEQAKQKGLPNALVQDAGLTELSPGTITTLGIGPAPSNIIDQVTSTLHLL